MVAEVVEGRREAAYAKERGLLQVVGALIQKPTANCLYMASSDSVVEGATVIRLGQFQHAISRPRRAAGHVMLKQKLACRRIASQRGTMKSCDLRLRLVEEEANCKMGCATFKKDPNKVVVVGANSYVQRTPEYRVLVRDAARPRRDEAVTQPL
jgi:hypothetical protein